MAKKKKKRDVLYLQYRCKDGSVTVASTASIGLMYWYDRILPKKPIENPQPFSIHVTTVSIPSPYNPLFLSLMIAGMERTFGTAPEIPAHLLDKAHAEKFPEGLNFGNVEKHLKKRTPVIVEYEQVCLELLYWLKDRGEITDRKSVV